MQHLFGTLHLNGTWVQIPAKWDRMDGHAGRSFKVLYFLYSSILAYVIVYYEIIIMNRTGQ